MASWAEERLQHLDPYTELAAHYVGEKFKYIPVFCVLLSAQFVLCFLVIHTLNRVHVLGLPAAKRAELTSCCVSLTHNFVAICGAAVLLVRLWPFHFDDPNTMDAHILLQFSVAYMIVDATHFLLPFTPNDMLFIGHHIVTGLYMYDCVAMQRAAVTVLVWLWLGEATGPLLNIFTAAKILKRGNKFWADVMAFVSPIFTIAFLLIRTIAMPLVLAWWTQGLLSDCAKVPMWHRQTWILLLGAGVAGSQVWSYKLLRGALKAKGTSKRE